MLSNAKISLNRKDTLEIQMVQSNPSASAPHTNKLTSFL